MRAPIVLSLICAASSSFALPNPDARFRAGANHHLGDDSFVAKHARSPGVDDTEKARMKDHLEHIRGVLTSRPATKPELASRRAELLGYLDDYIAHGITPTNAHLPWRAPVFIDDQGAVCAVGYLIERSVGRALPETIAKDHRYEFLEEIEETMPEVRSWIVSSGFTLDELASIQPAYSSPNIETWRTWDLANHAPKDGTFEIQLAGWGQERKVTGTIANKTLHGAWTVADFGTGVVIGTGTLNRGRGTWKSFYNDGKRVLATGEYANSKAHGAWTFFHPSGNVAAVGRMTSGMRTGEWSFFYDTSSRTPIARGTFARSGAVTGVWQHFDPAGKLLARTYAQGGNVIDITADERGVTEQIHGLLDPTSPVEAVAHRLEKFTVRDETVFVQHSGFAANEVVLDPEGFKLTRSATGWTAANCHWPAKRKEIAAAGNVPWLHTILHRESRERSAKPGEYGIQMTVDKGPSCDGQRPVATARAAKLDLILATRKAIRAPTPEFIKLIVLGQELEGKLEETQEESEDPPDDPLTEPTELYQLDRDDRIGWQKDLRNLLATGTIAYVEWIHIDGRFSRVLRTLAGHYSWEWHSSENEADGTNPLENNGP